MLKKALATAGIAAVALGASAGFASAAPADNGQPLYDGTDICNAPSKTDPKHQDAYTGILKKGDPINQVVSAILPKKNIILGLCDNQDLPDKGGDEGKGDQGGDKGTPVPAPGGDTDGPGNSDGTPGGGNDNNQGGGDHPFPAPSLA